MGRFRLQLDSRRGTCPRFARVPGAIASLAILGILSACGSNPVGPTPTPPPVVIPPPTPQPPVPPPVAPRLSQLRFLAFGDSLTFGVVHLAVTTSLDAGLPVSYPYKLQTMLKERYTDQQPIVMNAGQGGERASEALLRLRTVLKESDPDVVLLLDGANDLLALGEGGIPATVDAMKELVRNIKGAGATPLLLLQPPQRDGLPKAAAAPFLDDYNDDLRRMAAVENVTVIDLYSQFDVALQGPDGLHPSEAGYARIAEIVFTAIKSLYELPAAAANQAR